MQVGVGGRQAVGGLSLAKTVSKARGKDLSTGVVDSAIMPQVKGQNA